MSRPAHFRHMAVATTLAMAALAAVPRVASATIYYWDTASETGYNAGTANWDTSTAAWTTSSSAPAAGAAPIAWVDGNDAYFSAAGTNTATITGSVTVGTLQNTAGSVTTTITGGTLQVNAGITDNGGSLTVNSAAILNGSGHRTAFTRYGTAMTVNGNISETSGSVETLRIMGTGTVTLGGTNTFTGGIQIYNGASLNLTKAAAAGTGGILFSQTSAANNTQTLSTTFSTDETVSSNLILAGGSGQVFVIRSDGAGAATFSGNMLFSVQAGSSGLWGSIGAAALKLGGTSSAANTMGTAIKDSGTGTNTTSLTKQDSGTWILTGANTYTGMTTIAAGKLVAGSTDTLKNAPGDVLIQGGSLASSVTMANLGGNLTMSSGTLDINGSDAGTLALAASKSLTISGGTLAITIADGTTYDQIAGSGSLNVTGGDIDLGNSSTIDYNASYQIFSGFAGSISGMTVSHYDTANWLASLDNTGTLSFSSLAVPEPASLLLLAASGGLTALRRQRRMRS